MHKYITGLVQNRKAKLLAVNCMPDHTHLFVGYKPSFHIPDFVKEIKVESNEFITDKKWVKGKFNWQETCLPVGWVMGCFPIPIHILAMLLNT